MIYLLKDLKEHMLLWSNKQKGKNCFFSVFLGGLLIEKYCLDPGDLKLDDFSLLFLHK